MGVPVATPVSSGDLLCAMRALAKGGEESRAFEDEVGNFLAIPYACSVDSGRTALYVALKAMRNGSPRDRVVLPAYVCPSVVRSVIKVGLKPVLCDVGAFGSGLDVAGVERAINRNTLAVVTAHLYGYPVDIGETLSIAHAHGAKVIEDAAQAFGARCSGQYAGTVGDAGVFSFGMSKALWAVGGGLAVTNHAELRSQMRRFAATLRPPYLHRQALAIAKASVIARLLRSHHLGPLATIWQRSLQHRDDGKDFDVAAMGQGSAALARILLRRAGAIAQQRSKNAAWLAGQLTGYPGILVPCVPPEAQPAPLRFPIVVENLGVKRELITRLRKEGIHVSEMYSRSSYEAVRELAGCRSHYPVSEFLSERMLNLPVHCYLREHDLEAIACVFRTVLGRRKEGTR